MLIESVKEVIYCCSTREFPSALTSLIACMDRMMLARSPSSELIVRG